MVLRNRLQVFCTALILLALLPVQPASSQSQGLSEEEQASVRVISSDEGGMTLEMTAPVYHPRAVEKDGESYTTLDVPGAQLALDPSGWKFPILSATIGLPPDAHIEMEVIHNELERLDGGVSLRPTFKYKPPEDIIPAEEQIPQDVIVPQVSQPIIPAAPVQLREAWLRDQRIATLSFYPLQYLPFQSSLVWNKTLQVQIRFVRDDSGVAQGVRSRDESPDFEALYRSALLNYEQARAWRAQPVAEGISSQSLAATVEVSGPRYKIVVDTDGVYRISYAQLDAIMDVDNLDPRLFKMTSQGLDVAIYVSGEVDGSFDPGDTITFYGQRFRGDVLAARYAEEGSNYLTYARQLSDGSYTTWTPQFNAKMLEKYTKENVYWLQTGQSGGLRMGTLVGTPDSSTYLVPDTYTTTVRAEQSNYWYSFNFSSEDTMYWDRIVDASQHIYTTTLTAISTEPFSATLRGEMVARAANSAHNPDHHTKIWLNNTGFLADDTLWDGISRYHFDGQVPHTFLLEGSNDLLLTQVLDLYAGQVPAELYFDWFEIEYDRRFLADENRITFERNENSQIWRYGIGGFSSPSVEVYEITNPWTPRRVLTPTYQGGTVTFEGYQAGKAAYAAYGADAIASPKSVTFYNPPDLKSQSNATDYLIITHASLLGAVQALANYRSAQGLDTMIVDVADLYNEFNDGIFHSIAIKNFLRYAYENWAQPPAYVVLVGDGHWDFFGSTFYNTTAPLLMPPHLAWVDPWQGEVDSTNLLATVAGDDIIPDLFISRIPVNNAGELNAVINKMIAYESGGLQNWQRHLLYIADNPDAAGDFETFADELIQDYHPAGFINDKIFTEDINCGGSGQVVCAPIINSQLTSTGASLLSYIGHGALSAWGGQIFRVSDIPLLTNSGKLPLLLSMTCLDGYSFHASSQGLVESLLRVANKGIVAAFSPTGLGVATGHDWLQRGFYDTLFEDGVWELGQAALAAKMNLFLTGSDDDLIHTFTIYGDPALHIQNPYGNPEVEATSAVDAGIAGSVVTYTLPITNTGMVSDGFAVSISGNLWPVTAPATVGPVPSGSGTTLSVSVQIPPSAGIDDSDHVNVYIRSQGDTGKSASVTLTTLTVGALYLPSLIR